MVAILQKAAPLEGFRTRGSNSHFRFRRRDPVEQLYELFNLGMAQPRESGFQGRSHQGCCSFEQFFSRIGQMVADRPARPGYPLDQASLRQFTDKLANGLIRHQARIGEGVCRLSWIGPNSVEDNPKGHAQTQAREVPIEDSAFGNLRSLQTQSCQSQ